MNNIKYVLLDKLDKQLYQSIKGNFDKSDQITKELLIERPYDNRVLYNAAFMYLRKGDIRTGMVLLNKGRLANVFGSPNLPYEIIPNTNVKNKTILFNLEGGLGDNFLGLKFARELAKYNKTIILAPKQLHSLLYYQDYIYKYYQYAIEIQERIDYWVPSLGIEVIFEYTDYSQIPNDPHLFYPKSNSSDNQYKIGIKFQGGKSFDHDHYRSPKVQDIIETISSIKNVQFYSLEKEKLDLPDWIIQPEINDWCDTANIIQRMDEVISTCTSVAHLSAGLGQKTNIIIPILPYWIWAYPKDNDNASWYYPNVKLFRQTKFKEWKDILDKLRKSIKK